MMLLILLLSVASALAKCPAGSIMSTTYNTCYMISTNEASWTAAESICKIMGGHLASVHSQEQNDYIMNLVINSKKDQSVFLGGNNVNNVWQNSDGSKFDFASFSNGNKPKYLHNVVQMDTGHSVPQLNGQWFVMQDYPTLAASFICSIPPCGVDGPAPSLLNPTDQNTGLIYGNLTGAWYYGSSNKFASESYAEADCKGIGAHLPSIHNAFQNSQFADIIYQFDIGKADIGLQNVNGEWVWTDGSNSTYTNWANNQPGRGTNANFNLKDQMWYAAKTSENGEFICEFHPDYRKEYC